MTAADSGGGASPLASEVPAAFDASEISEDISDARASDMPAVLVFALLFFVVVLQFFTRYVLNDSLGWTEEIARYFLILLAFAGGVMCTRRRSHISLECVYYYLPSGAARVLRGAAQLLTALFFCYCSWLAFELARRSGSNMVSVALPKSLIYYFVAVACAFIGGFAALHLARPWRWPWRRAD